VSRFGVKLTGISEEGPLFLFPGAEVLQSADVGSVGLPGKRAEAIRTLARRVVEGQVDLCGSRGPAVLEEELTSIPGIGHWTAQYLAMRCLGEPDAFPDGDLGLLRALSRLGVTVSRRDLIHRAEAWRPWRAYATMHLWTSEENP
jgi:3-methyladenine DNA glycosylase/8-oxoguanine DNA glycosylase